MQWVKGSSAAIASLAFGCVFSGACAEDDKPFRLNDVLNTPDWLDISGSSRLRYETLDGRFRSNFQGSDQFLGVRTLIDVRARAGRFTFGAELQDSRAYLDDEGTPLSTSFVNAAEFIQLNVSFDAGDVLGADSETAIKVGRMTVDVGSERFIERNGFRNTINSYDGIHLTTDWASGRRLDALFVAPVRAEPRDLESLLDNDIEIDRPDENVRFWGAIYTDENIIPSAQAEVFAYGLHEKDTSERQTADREIYTTGFRVIRRPSVGQMDFEVEAATQFGQRRETSDPADLADINVNAQVLHAELGYTFNQSWEPRLSFEYDFASGDDDPTDDTDQGYDRLLGGRRGDLGFTSIFGPLVRTNISVPGVDFEVKPNDRTDAFLSYQAAFLDSATDDLSVARLRDPSGAAGDFIGHTLDGRIRYSIIPDVLRWEIGGSALFFGEFLENVPGGATDSRTLYGFTQITASF